WGLSRAVERLQATGRLALERERTLRAQLEAVTDVGASEAVRRLESEQGAVEADLGEASAAHSAAQADVAARAAAVEAASRALGDAERALEEARAAQRETAAEALSV